MCIKYFSQNFKNRLLTGKRCTDIEVLPMFGGISEYQCFTYQQNIHTADRVSRQKCDKQMSNFCQKFNFPKIAKNCGETLLEKTGTNDFAKKYFLSTI